MKRFYSIAVILFAATSLFAQNAELRKWAEKAPQSKPSVVVRNNNGLNKAGIYLEKSAKFQYNALICAGVGAGLSILGSSTSEYAKNGDSQKSERNLYFIAGGCFGAAALVCSIMSIDYKLKAGRSLRVFSTGGGAGLAYSF